MSTRLSLLREKFTIREIGVTHDPVIALGNRIAIPLAGQDIPIIIRCHSMHMTLRYGMEVIKQLSYYDDIENVETVLDWRKIWGDITQKFEREYTPNTWLAIYHKGKPIYTDGFHHMFIDVVEQCEFQNKNGYDHSLTLAQNAFSKMGKSVMIDHESHAGFILDQEESELRFAIMMRIPGQKSNFVVRLSDNKNKVKPQSHDAMALASYYIEAINMAVRIGFMEKSFTEQKIEPSKDKEFKVIQNRLFDLTRDISLIENKFTARYRPERPDFDLIQENCSGLKD